MCRILDKSERTFTKSILIMRTQKISESALERYREAWGKVSQDPAEIERMIAQLKFNYVTSVEDIKSQHDEHFAAARMKKAQKGTMLIGGKYAPYKDDAEYQEAVKNGWENKKEILEEQMAFYNNLVPALLFWELFRKELDWYESTPDNCYAIAHMYVEDENPLISLIAKIESLPDPVWRRLLWRENIDFLSFESFLRRINNDQIQAINDNYSDLQEGKIPRVYRKSLRDRLKIFVGRIKFESIIDRKSYYGDDRYFSKGSWAYSLLGLDFGFGKYPNGLADDTEIKDKSFTRFLSIKNHINDFVVDQEFGKYWLLYRTARSNYAWNFDKKVQISTHICPGFWWTLIVHSMFWILSPILFPLFAKMVMVSEGGVATAGWILAAALVSLTPIWTFVAILRFGISLFFGTVIAYGVDDAIEDWWWDHGDKIKQVFRVIGIIIVAIILLFILFAVASFLYPIIVSIGVFLYDMMMNEILSFIWFTMITVSIIGSMWLVRLTYVNEKLFAKLAKFIRFAGVAMAVSFFALMSYNWLMLGAEFVSMEFISFSLVAVGLLIVTVHLTYPINLDTISYREKSKKNRYQMVNFLAARFNNIRISRQTLMKNKFLSTLEEDDLWRVLGKMETVVNSMRYFSNSLSALSSSVIIGKLLACLKDEKGLDRLLALIGDDEANLRDAYYSDDIPDFMAMVLDHKPLSEIKNVMAAKTRETKAQRDEEYKQELAFDAFIDKWFKNPALVVIGFLGSVLYFLATPLRWLINWVGDKVETLGNLWELFNERCPWVQKPENLNTAPETTE